MIEVEIRAGIGGFDIVRNKLRDMGAVFLKIENQEDLIFGNKEFLDSDKMVVEGGFVARIRKIDEDIFLEFKEIRRESGGVEISSKISNKKDALVLLEKLHFKKSFSVSKRREIFSYEDFLICLDEVKEIGNFIEIEKRVYDESDKNKAREECISFLKKIDRDLIVENRKYGDIVQEKKNERY